MFFSKSLIKQKYACLSITSLAERACVKAAWAGVVTSLIRNMVLTISLLVYRGETERNLADKDLHSTTYYFPGGESLNVRIQNIVSQIEPWKSIQSTT